jgi:hypothetical protein
MEAEGSSSCSLQLANCPFPEADKTRQQTPTYFLKTILTLSHPRYVFPVISFHHVLPPKRRMHVSHLMRATCPIRLSLHDLIISVTSGE